MKEIEFKGREVRIQAALQNEVGACRSQDTGEPKEEIPGNGNKRGVMPKRTRRSVAKR